MICIGTVETGWGIGNKGLQRDSEEAIKAVGTETLMLSKMVVWCGICEAKEDVCLAEGWNMSRVLGRGSNMAKINLNSKRRLEEDLQ
jgi:hypothetical protein